MSIFLHGGGGAVESFRPFTERCPKIALISYVDDGDTSVFAEIVAILEQAGAKSIQPFAISKIKPLDFASLQRFQPDGIFVCGGVTPDYHAVLCNDSAFIAYLKSGVHYCGTSAGAAIASKTAILGGWRVNRGNRSTQMIFEGASEGLEILTVREGLGLIDAGVDVHASQWGTLSRLIHAVDTGAVSHGYAIDENTMLLCDSMRVHGEGQVYDVRKAEKGVLIHILSST
jgi:cyanophycinase